MLDISGLRGRPKTLNVVVVLRITVAEETDNVRPDGSAGKSNEGAQERILQQILGVFVANELAKYVVQVEPPSRDDARSVGRPAGPRTGQPDRCPTIS
jgi:hypothetical protein